MPIDYGCSKDTAYITGLQETQDQEAAQHTGNQNSGRSQSSGIVGMRNVNRKLRELRLPDGTPLDMSAIQER